MNVPTRIEITEGANAASAEIVFSCGHRLHWPVYLMDIEDLDASVRAAILTQRRLAALRDGLISIAQADDPPSGTRGLTSARMDPRQYAVEVLLADDTAMPGCIALPQRPPVGLFATTPVPRSIVATIRAWNLFRHERKSGMLILRDSWACPACDALNEAKGSS